jgi:hypothetical protein
MWLIGSNVRIMCHCKTQPLPVDVSAWTRVWQLLIETSWADTIFVKAVLNLWEKSEFSTEVNN